MELGRVGMSGRAIRGSAAIRVEDTNRLGLKASNKVSRASMVSKVSQNPSKPIDSIKDMELIVIKEKYQL